MSINKVVEKTLKEINEDKLRNVEYEVRITVEKIIEHQNIIKSSANKITELKKKLSGMELPEDITLEI